MRDFTIKDVVKSFAPDYALIPEHVLIRVCQHGMREIIRVMKTRKGYNRIMMKNMDIHSIYQEIVQEDIANITMDLDETRDLSAEETYMIKSQRYESKGVYPVRVSNSRQIYRINPGRHLALRVRPQVCSKDSDEVLPEHGAVWEELQDSFEEASTGDI